LEVLEMYQKGALIVYGSCGVCRVEEIGPLKGMGDKKRDYYTLAPVFGSGVVYTPVDTGVYMRPVLSREEVEQLISRLPELEGEEDVSNLRALTERCHAAFESHQCEDLLRLIKTLHRKGQMAVKQGRRLGLTELKYRKHAEELVHGEFAVALGIPYEEVPGYIEAHVSQMEPAVSQV
jgi:CarD family transcriptional regulator